MAEIIKLPKGGFRDACVVQMVRDALLQATGDPALSEVIAARIGQVAADLENGIVQPAPKLRALGVPENLIMPIAQFVVDEVIHHALQMVVNYVVSDSVTIEMLHRGDA